jgi:hypothetical protein
MSDGMEWSTAGRQTSGCGGGVARRASSRPCSEAYFITTLHSYKAAMLAEQHGLESLWILHCSSEVTAADQVNRGSRHPGSHSLLSRQLILMVEHTSMELSPPETGSLLVALRRAEEEIFNGDVAGAENTLTDCIGSVVPSGGDSAVGLKVGGWIAFARSALRSRQMDEAVDAISQAIRTLISAPVEVGAGITLGSQQLLRVLNDELHRRGLSPHTELSGPVQREQRDGSQVNWSLDPKLSLEGGILDEHSLGLIGDVVQWAQSIFRLGRKRRPKRKVRTGRLYRLARDTDLLEEPVHQAGPVQRLTAGTIVQCDEIRDGWARVHHSANLSISGWVQKHVLTLSLSVPHAQAGSAGVPWDIDPPLAVVADLNAFPPELLAELLAALDELHRAHGGGGLRILRAQTGAELTAGAGV